MAFIDTSNTLIGVEINQIDAAMSRRTGRGGDVQVCAGHITWARSRASCRLWHRQAQTSGTAILPKTIETVPFVVRVNSMTKNLHASFRR